MTVTRDGFEQIFGHISDAARGAERSSEAVKLLIHLSKRCLDLAESLSIDEELPGADDLISANCCVGGRKKPDAIVLDYGSLARRAYRARRLREDAFHDPDLFSEPAWDILLEAYEHTLQDKLMSVSHACIAAAVPNTTGLRWVHFLVDKGYLKRTDDPTDGRRSLLKLSPKGSAAMSEYFRRLGLRDLL